jgi:pimeloyl-ACP methyl ester carboxylesterase
MGYTRPIMKRAVVILVFASLLAGGCKQLQPYVTDARLERGLVIVLPGIEGRSVLNEDIARGLIAGGVNWAVEIQDWTSSWGPLHNLRATERNHKQARLIYERIQRYRHAFPNRPVMLLGHSGGGAIAIWTAEAFDQRESLEGLILVNASISREYDLTDALNKTRRGIVSYYSAQDWMLLGVGTTVYGTMDGSHSVSAGKEGFLVPTDLPRAYDKLYQISWTKQMAEAGHRGGHFSSADSHFVARVIAPLIRAENWSDDLVREVQQGQGISTEDSPARPPEPVHGKGKPLVPVH